MTAHRLQFWSLVLNTVIAVLFLCLVVMLWLEIQDHRKRNEQAHYTNKCLLLHDPSERTTGTVRICEEEAEKVHPPEGIWP